MTTGKAVDRFEYSCALLQFNEVARIDVALYSHVILLGNEIEGIAASALVEQWRHDCDN